MPILVLLLVAAIVEISVLVAIGQVIGVWPTLGLLVVAAVLGSWLVRREGRRTLREINEAVRAKRPPTREFADGALIAVGGILIILPGFVSDVLGLLCLFPPTRALARRRMQRAAERRSQQMQDQVWLHTQRIRREQTAAGGGAAAGFGSRSGADDGVIDGEVISVTEDDDPSHGDDGTRSQIPGARGGTGPSGSSSQAASPDDSSGR
ncbi:UPF0716 protein FxsA [Saccharopolyspora erythraea NRRL 2338]|uniref:Uncharacterized protein n=1 Tax=Saccharopolyspora erythraea TaxID=1836 RepID=A0ABN1DCR9_SACER|nr:FxsA family protein [Saccharopolyspora erythraea]EQD84639.1 exlusion protein FxsA [Saccharopolyspora erythraea D]PFG95359.1 UPF0716 protein FxsA [Saccharopolyspora erythraea NRRL 2338]QRK92002.1 FxsA family protein [Saccharopolyspora erythraea]